MLLKACHCCQMRHRGKQSSCLLGGLYEPFSWDWSCRYLDDSSLKFLDSDWWVRLQRTWPMTYRSEDCLKSSCLELAWSQQSWLSSEHDWQIAPSRLFAGKLYLWKRQVLRYYALLWALTMAFSVLASFWGDCSCQLLSSKRRPKNYLSFIAQLKKILSFGCLEIALVSLPSGFRSWVFSIQI